MVHVNKNAIKLFIIALLILTYIQLSDSKGGGRGGGSRGSKGSRGWFSSLFGSKKKTGSIGIRIPKPSVSNEHSNKPSKETSGSNHQVLSHPNENLPGGINPPRGVKQPYGFPSVNTYNNIHAQPPSYSLHLAPGHQSLEGHQLPPPYSSHLTTSSSRYAYSHPPPPPGFLNTRGTGGAAPDYTYNINDFLSRGSNGGFTAGLALWEISKHRSHYKVYHGVTMHGFTLISEQPEQKEIEAGEIYIVTPTDVECQFVCVNYTTNFKLVISCDTNRNLEIRIVFPSNKTAVINCRAFLGVCSGNGIFANSDLTPVDFKMFNETAVYGVPLCNTTVIGGYLAIVYLQYTEGSSPCVYPPYKWTGKEWINLEERQQKEKIKENMDSVYNVRKLEDKTLRTLAHSMSFGKLYDLFDNTIK